MAILAFDGGIGIFHGAQGLELKATIFAAILVKGHGWFPPHQILVFIVDWVNARMQAIKVSDGPVYRCGEHLLTVFLIFR